MSSRVLGWIAVGLSIAAAVLLLASIWRVGVAFWWFSDLAGWATTTLGLDEPAATLFAIAGIAAATFAVPYFAAFAVLGRRRTEVSVISVVAAVVAFVLLTTIGDKVYFDQRTGLPLRYYVDTPEGIIFTRQGGFDKKTGVRRMPVTPGIMLSLERERAGIRPNKLKVKSLNDVEVFDKVLNGKAKVWVYLSPAGEYELFDGPGFHPQSRAPLTPMTPALVTKANAYLAEVEKRMEAASEAAKRDSEVSRRSAEYAKYVRAASSDDGRHELTVKCADDSRRPNNSLAVQIAKRYARGREHISTDLLSDEFITEGMLDYAMGGDLRVAGSALAARVRRVVLCRAKTNVSDSGEQGLLKATAELEIREIDSYTGRSLWSTSVSASGSGFSPQSATERAWESAVLAVTSKRQGT